MQTLVISYFCDVDGNTYYSDHGKRFKENCEQFEIPYHISHIESKGSYKLNCLLKPKFIYSKLIEFQKPLLWLDIDTFILKKPDVFDGFSVLGVNIAVSSPEPHILFKTKASPLWFNYNTDSLEFIRKWISMCEQVESSDGNLFDHEPLISCLTEYSKEKKLAILNSDYCTWPGYQNENTVLLMGLSDSPSKKEVLKKMGYSDDMINWQSPGNSFMETKV